MLLEKNENKNDKKEKESVHQAPAMASPMPVWHQLIILMLSAYLEWYSVVVALIIDLKFAQKWTQ